MIGCYFVMFTIAAYGLSLATIQQPMLDSMGGGSYFSLITLIAAICMTIMTPIGGRLIDGLGNRTVTLYAGAISLISGLVMAFVPNLWVFIIMRILFSMAQGAMSSVPYILAREVNPPRRCKARSSVCWQRYWPLAVLSDPGWRVCSFRTTSCGSPLHSPA